MFSFTNIIWNNPYFNLLFIYLQYQKYVGNLIMNGLVKIYFWRYDKFLLAKINTLHSKSCALLLFFHVTHISKCPSVFLDLSLTNHNVHNTVSLAHMHYGLKSPLPSLKDSIDETFNTTFDLNEMRKAQRANCKKKVIVEIIIEEML